MRETYNPYFVILFQCYKLLLLQGRHVKDALNFLKIFICLFGCVGSSLWHTGSLLHHAGTFIEVHIL